MRELAVRGMLAAALFAGLALAARAADDEEEAPPAPTGLAAWWGGLFGGKDKPAEKVEKKKKTEVPEKAAGPSSAQRADTVRRRELNNYFRRIAVCDRLQEIADAKNDVDMQDRVQQLTEQVWELYVQRTAGLGAGDGDDEVRKPQPKVKAGTTFGGPRTADKGEGEQ